MDHFEGYLFTNWDFSASNLCCWKFLRQSKSFSPPFSYGSDHSLRLSSIFTEEIPIKSIPPGLFHCSLLEIKIRATRWQKFDTVLTNW